MLLIALIVGTDRIISWRVAANGPAMNLIFPSQSFRTLTTSEFSHTVDVNRLGFRDREFNSKVSDVVRIIAIGDSFTYGLGVQIEDTWVKLAERKLQGEGFKVEIANLGQPGAHPKSYAELAKKAIPVLTPDLVLLAVLQGDDLAQSKVRSEPFSESRVTLDPQQEPGRTLLERIHHSLPGWSYIANRTAAKRQIVDLRIVRENRRQAAMKNMTEEELALLNGLDSGVLHALENGGLNPAIVSLALKNPSYFAVPIDVEDAGYLLKSDNMSWEFGQTKLVAEQFKAKVLVSSVPYGIYVSERAHINRGRLAI